MTNKQWFTISILGFVLLLVVSIGGYAYAITNNIADILQSPAATSEFSMEGEITIVTEQATITIHKLSGSVNSKILDLILLAVND